MERTLFQPFVIYVVAKLFNQLRNTKGIRWSMSAPLDLDSCRPPVSRITRYAKQRRAMKCQQMGRAKLERPIRFEKLLDHLNHDLKLLQTVLNLLDSA